MVILYFFGLFAVFFLIAVEATRPKNRHAERVPYMQHLGDVIHDLGVAIVGLGWRISGRNNEQ